MRQRMSGRPERVNQYASANPSPRGGDQLVAAVAGADGEHLDVFADDSGGDREGSLVSEGVLERR